MLQFLWNIFAYLGIQHVDHQEEQKHVILINSISIFLIFFMIISLLVFNLLLHLPEAIYLTLIYLFLMPLTLYFNQKGKINFARYYLLILSLFFIIFLTIIFGSNSNGHFFLLTIILINFFAFPSKKSKDIFIFNSIILFVFFNFEFLPYFSHSLIHIEYPRILKNANVSLFSILFTAFCYYIYSTFRKSENSLKLEHNKSQNLLLNIFPASVIHKLKENPETIADSHAECTVLFSDIVGFTELSRKLTATELVNLLNNIFSIFDDLIEKYGLEKIKTIGDAYMVAGGLPEPDPDHAKKIAYFALEMIELLKIQSEKIGIILELRIGIHSGNAVAGVIGKKKFIYDLWGESVNTASRMESSGIPGAIQVSESTYFLLKDEFYFSERKNVHLKGIGVVNSYILIGKKSSKNT
jgi:adenylate cyclase